MKQSLRTTIRTIKADLLTPVLIFKRLSGKRKFLLESSTKYEDSGRYSFIGANPRKTYTGVGQQLEDVLHKTNKSYTYEGPLMQSLKQVMPRISSYTDYPFIGGAVGYVSYDLENTEQPAQPELQFHIYETLIIFDHIKDELTIAHTNIDAEENAINIDQIIEALFTHQLELVPTFEVQSQAIDTVNLQPVVKRLNAQFTGDPFELYRKIRVQLPGAYLYYIEFDDQTLIGASKENFVAVTNDEIKANSKQFEYSETMKCALQKVAANITGDAQLTAEMQPGNHSLDVLKALLPPAPLHYAQKLPYKNGFGHVVGYIGFNGQIDFTLAENIVRIEGKTLFVTANEHFDKLQQMIEQLVVPGGIV